MSGKPAKPGKPGGSGKPDRTKYGPTPGRGEQRGPAPRRRLPSPVSAVLRALLPLAGIALGVGVAIGGAAAMGDVRALHHRPELRMTMTECHTTGQSRSAVNHCRGTGDPGSTGVTTGTWYYNGAPNDYRVGTVATVRCTPDGSCERLGVGNHALSAGATVGGLLLAGGALTALVRTLLESFAPARAAALTDRRTVRVLLLVAGAVLLLTVAASVLYMLS
ncbi:hypothetical protein [Kitasatospora sp. NRRL B-11411]|uniref:hypothetical protein n=1 Tax=Kitasatospora sp. NRRL B-11411 TaxID=1463822 RepID=UPI0012FECC57|nr:hypothetical protein [Kitasatospora sp. NRRL B-11411]